MTETVLVYLGLVAAPSLAFLLARRGAERLASWPGPRRRAVAGPTRPALDRLCQHLRRLDAELAQLEESALPAKRTRLRTLALAYDDVLVDCCDALGLPDPGPVPLAPEARLHTEAALAQHGLTW